MTHAAEDRSCRRIHGKHIAAGTRVRQTESAVRVGPGCSQHAPGRLVVRVVRIDDEKGDRGVSDRTSVLAHHRAAHGPRYRAVADLHVAYVVETRCRVGRVNRIEAAAEIEVDNDHRPGVGDLDWRIGKQAETEAAWVSTPVDAR